MTKCPVLKVVTLQLQLHLELQINPSRPNIHFQILHTNLNTFPQQICQENLIKDHFIDHFIDSCNLFSLLCIDIDEFLGINK